MIRRLAFGVACFALMVAAVCSAWAAAYSLTDRTTLEGEPISYNAQGVVVKKSDGTFAPRVAWTNLTQDALKVLYKDPKAKAFVEPYVEIDEPDDKKPKLEIKPKDHPRTERPDPKAGLGAMFASPLSVMMFLLLYGANIYAAYEVSLFRNQHPGLVCGISAVAPVLGPIIFLCIPTRAQHGYEEESLEGAEPAEAHQLAYTHPQAAEEGQAGPEGPGAGAPAAAQSKVTVYKRGQTTFNRRFFETKFAGFLRMVPGEAEKDMEICVKSARGEHVGSRLTRILQNELTLQVAKGDATAEVIIPFVDIFEVHVRPKTA
jgi:hypothetical protein